MSKDVKISGDTTEFVVGFGVMFGGAFVLGLIAIVIVQDYRLEGWGNLGGFIGGVLGTLISLYALMLLFKTYSLQKMELINSRKQLEESSFYNLLKLYTDVADQVHGRFIFDNGNVSDKFDVYKGRGFIFHVVRNSGCFDKVNGSERFFGLEETGYRRFWESFFKKKYDRFWYKYGRFLSHYVRTIDAVLMCIKNSERSREFLDIFIHCLSDIEIELCFYRFVAGEDERFRELVLELDFFNQITERERLNNEIGKVVLWIKEGNRLT